MQNATASSYELTLTTTATAAADKHTSINAFFRVEYERDKGDDVTYHNDEDIATGTVEKLSLSAWKDR